MMQDLNLLGLMVEAKLRKFFYNEDGEVNIVAIVILIGIAVTLALVFKDQITKLLNDLFGTINQKATNAVAG